MSRSRGDRPKRTRLGAVQSVTMRFMECLALPMRLAPAGLPRILQTGSYVMRPVKAACTRNFMRG